MSEYILIKGGEVIDGTGKPAVKADVLIKDDLIEEIGKIEKFNGASVIDARNLVVAPGFIDIHTHLDFFLPSPRHASVLESWVRMGVTTLVGGLCGFSPAPINHEHVEDLNIYWNFAIPKEGLNYEWTSFGQFLDYLDEIGQAFNVAMLTGHNTLRNNVMGFQARFANDDEINEMKRQLKQSLDEGSFGLSVGLGYVPGIFSHTNEIMEVASVLKDYNRPLVTHPRGLSNQYHKAIEEVIFIAEKNRIPLQISHNSSVSLKAGPKAQKIIKAAIERGINIGYDNIPYASGCSTAFCALPPLLLDGGIKKCYKRLLDPEIRRKVIDDIKNYRIKWPNWEHDYWTDKFLKETKLSKLLGVKTLMHGFKLEKNRRFENMNLRDIAKELGKNYIDTFLDFILEERGGIFFTAVIADGKFGDRFIAKAIKDPNCSIITDHVGADFDTAHPVQYGAFTKVLGQFARDRGMMTMEEAIRKMTSLPASQMQLDNRSTIKKGFFADITIFNPETVNCRATFKNPRLPSEGIEYVIINGKIVLEKGNCNSEALAGKALRKVK